jgi:hypothetical protein
MRNMKLKAKIIEAYGAQYRFALAAGVSDATVSRVINGAKFLSKEEKQMWSRLINCNQEELFNSYQEEEEQLCDLP